MKEGWKKVKLGEIGTFLRGINFLKSDFVDDGFPCIHYGQIHTKLGNITRKHLTCIPESIVKQDKLASKGDILIAITSEDVAGSCKCTAWLGDYDIALGAHAAMFKHNQNPAFIVYYFQSNQFYVQKEQYTHGFKVVEIKPSDIAKIEIPLPPLPEQQRIVEYLDSTFAEIDALKAKAAEEVANAKAMFDAALREEMTPKEGWEEKTLPQISENLDNRRKPVTKGKREEGIYPYYGASGIVDYVGGFLFDEDILLISEDGANLLARSTPIAFSVCGKVWVNNHAHVLKFPTLIQQIFVEYYFASINIADYVTGAAQPKLSQKNLNIIPIPVPSLIEQRTIVTRLDSLRSLLTELEQKYAKIAAECDALKQAILKETFE